MRRTIVILAIGVLPCLTAFSQSSARRVEEIDKLVDRINQDIARSDQEPEHSNIYLTELAVNKGNGSYPAVGIYRPVVKFYYTYGDREKDPYPNRVLKIVVTIDRSDRKEHAELVFNGSEQLVFYLEKKDDIERRLYFLAGRPIRLEENETRLSLKLRAHAAIVTSVRREKAHLMEIFRRSLRF